MIDLLPLLDWTDFVYFATPTFLLLVVSVVSALMSKRSLAIVAGALAVVVFAFFIGGMWHHCSARRYAQWARHGFGTRFLLS